MTKRSNEKDEVEKTEEALGRNLNPEIKTGLKRVVVKLMKTDNKEEETNLNEPDVKLPKIDIVKLRNKVEKYFKYIYKFRGGSKTAI